MIMKTCSVCGDEKEETAFNTKTRDQLRRRSECKVCAEKVKSALRRDKKFRLLTAFGGKCSNPLCGYDKCLGALDFHHTTGEKSFELNRLQLSYERLFAEAQKCRLLCANCHRELHNCPEIFLKVSAPV